MGVESLKIKESVESNPLIYLLGTAVTVGMFVGGIQEYFCREKVEIANQHSGLEIGALQSELASIKRGLGESKYLDVRNFVYPKNRSPLSPINARTKYVSSDEFYAILDLADWNYEAMSVEDFDKRLYSVSLSPLWKQMVGDSRIHVWVSKALTNVTAADDYRETGPYITLQKTPISKLMG
jgi:hypothetical protein